MNLLYTDFHCAERTDPLPIRERNSSESGRCAALVDFALLDDLCYERTVLPKYYGRIDVYPHRAVWGGTAGGNAWFARIQMLPVAADYFLDPDWTPVAGDGEWYLEEASHKLALVSPTVAPGDGIRRLDDIRRMYYDVKRMHRFRSDCLVSFEMASGSHLAVPSYERDENGAVYTSTATSISVGAIRNLSDQVLASATATLEFAVADVTMTRTEYRNGQQAGPTEYAYRHVPLVANNGALPVGPLQPEALKAMLTARFGTFAAGWEYSARADIHSSGSTKAVYHHIDFPNDNLLVPWNWTPQS